jgi:hypothetical protein
MNKRAVWVITLCLFLIGAGAAGWRLMFPGRFDTVRWQAVDSPQSFLRRREMMRDVDRLLDDHTISLKPSAVQQLGQPQRRSDADDVWLYDLGSESAGNAPGPHHWLELRFGAQDQLVAHRVIQE